MSGPLAPKVRLKPDATTAIVSLLLSAAIVAGCSSPQKTESSPAVNAGTSKTPDGRDLRTVTLPDLSRMSPSAQKQIRDQYALLIKTTGGRPSVADSSNAYGDLGKLLLAAQYYDAAEACLLNAQSLDPSEFRWPYYLAHLYRNQGDVVKSRSLFERANQLRPDDVSTLVWLGNAYLDQGQPDAADAQFSKALALDSRSISARYGAGRAALARNDYRRAVTNLEEVLKMDPKAVSAHYPLSLAYNGLGDSRKADEHLRQRGEHQILPADPLMVELESLVQSPQTYETLGVRALERDDWTGAATQFRKGLELEPGSASLKFRLATALNMAGDAVGSEALFEEVVRTSPSYFPAQYSLGVIRQGQGRHQEAVDRFSAALVERPDYAEAHLRLAVSLRHLRRPKEALPHYQQVMAANPRNADALFGYATTLAQLGRDQDALAQLMSGIKAFPDQLIFTHGLARLLATSPDDRVRDGQRAMALVQDLVKQGRTLELGETLAMALAELGEYEQAASIQRDVMKSADRAGLTTVARRLSTNLALYERHQPCRTPWAQDEIL